MSQAGIVDFEGAHPQVPTTFVADVGFAVPIANTLEILGTTVTAHSIPLETTGSGNTITVVAQYASANSISVATGAGMASFNSAMFTVDANGFVSFTGTGAGETITGNSGGPLSPTAGNWNILGTGSTTTVGSVSTLTVQLTGLTNHAVLVGAGTATITKVGPTATAGQVLQSAGAAADPVFSTATYPATTTINQVLYSSSNNVVAGITAANNGTLISGTTGVPSWLANGTTGQVLTATTGSPPSWAPPATSGTVTTVSVVSANGFAGTVANASTTPAITLTTTITGVLSGNGTAITGSAITQYDVLVGGATNAISSVGPGSVGQVLQSGGNAANPAYSTATYPSTTTVSQILYSSSTNVVAGLATANSATLVTTSAGVPVFSSTMINGQLIIGSTGATPTAATLTAGAGIAITNGAGSITIALTGAGIAIDSIGTQTGTNPIGPDGAGLVTINGAAVAAGTNPVRSDGTGANTMAIEVQTSQAIAAADATKIGLCNFDSASFAVAATGFVTLTGGGAFTWNDVSGAFSPLKNNGYFITGTATGTLPASPSQGDTIKFFVDHASQVLTIQATSGKIIRLGNQVSSAAGTFVSTAQGDSVELTYRASDTCWCAISGISGTWTFT